MIKLIFMTLNLRKEFYQKNKFYSFNSVTIQNKKNKYVNINLNNEKNKLY